MLLPSCCFWRFCETHKYMARTKFTFWKSSMWYTCP